jgi:coenzyme Q-binding protein COQ10
MPTHAEKQIVPYTQEQLFDLVADVDKYPRFLPWCVAARVRHRTETHLMSDLTIGFGPFRESFTSRVTLDRPRRVNVRYESGPFRYLNNQWDFAPHDAGTEVAFFVDFEFRSRLLQAAIGLVFNEATKRMVNAFRKRAHDVYGPSPFRQERIDASGSPTSGPQSSPQSGHGLRPRPAGSNPPTRPGEPVLGHPDPTLASHEGRNDASGGG